jgi:hypothetical protein
VAAALPDTLGEPGSFKSAHATLHTILDQLQTLSRNDERKTP